MNLLESKLDLIPIPQIIKNEVEITDVQSKGTEYTVFYKLKRPDAPILEAKMVESKYILLDKFIKFKKKLSERDFVEFYNATVGFMDSI